MTGEPIAAGADYPRRLPLRQSLSLAGGTLSLDGRGVGV